jgi:hypothetical protein
MTTFKELVDEVSLNLQGFTLRQDRSTHLTQNATSSATTLSVASVENIGKGIVQIDDELVWIDSFDRTAGTLTIPPYGRGYLGSTKTAHDAGDQVIISPTFPRYNIKKAINDTVRAVFPTIFGTGVTTFEFNPAQTTYALPTDVDTVLGLSWSSVGPSQEWVPIRSWRVDSMSNVDAFDSHYSISIYDNVMPGRTVQVYYSKEPDTFEIDSDDFEITTGLPISCKDVIVYGAAYRLSSMVDPGRLTFTSPEADIQSTRIQYGAATNASRYLLALYQQRLDEESRKLSGRFPIRVHYTR